MLSATADRSSVKASITADSRNIWGNIHGGLIYTMADAAAGAMAHAGHRKHVTLNAAIDYLRAAGGADTIYAHGSAVKVGRSIGVYHVSIKTEEDIELAVAKITMFFLEKTENCST